MSAVVVGGVPIPVAPGGVKRDRLDGTDRARAFDQTYRVSQTGLPKRDFHFSTPPVLRSDGDSYETTLGIIGAQSCSGDILGATLSCCAEITDWTPVVVLGAHRVVISFVLHEV